jgi:CRISPR-associated protein Cmr6
VSKRPNLPDVNECKGSNPALILDFYANFNLTKKIPFEGILAGVEGVKDLYKQAFERWKCSIADAKTATVETESNRILVGSGETVYETSIRLHGTLGTPIIPGSALKGLASKYAANVWGEKDKGFGEEGNYYKCLFGTNKEQGLIVFHDAWIEPGALPESLLMDVLTVHYPEYYRGKVKNGVSIESDEPVPVPFLSVQGSFLIAVSPLVPGEQAEKWAQLALDLVLEALEEWGVGAKTSAGYGRLYKRTITSSVKLSYKAGDIVTARRVTDSGRGSKKQRQKYEVEGGYFGHVQGLDDDVQIGVERQLRVTRCDAGQKTLGLEIL